MKYTTRGMRMGLASVAVLLLAGVLASSASAAKSSDLDGTYAIVGTITGDDDPATVGTKIDRTYKFSCANSSCKKVRFTREGANGSSTKSVLTRTSASTYEGVETQGNPVCIDQSPATSRVADITVEIVKAKKGIATKIKGELHFTTTGCADDTFQDTTFTGKAK